MKNKKALIPSSLHLVITFLLIPTFLFSQQITPSVWMSSGSVGTMTNGNQYSWSMGETFTATLPSSTLTFTQGFQQSFPLPGCTDPTAFNYNASAGLDDGSCIPVLNCSISALQNTMCQGETSQLFLNTTGGGSLYRQLPAGIQNGLIHYFPLDGNGNNILNNAVPVNNVGGFGYGVDRFLMSSKCAVLNGSQSVSANLSGWDVNQDYTLSMWVKADGNIATPQTLFSTGSFNDGGVNLIYSPSSTVPWMFLTGSGGASTSNPPVDTEWHHIVAKRAGNWFYLYIDGVELGSSTVSGTPNLSYNAGIAYWGQELGTTNGFGGAMDDIQIWNRALSAEEVTYLSGSAGRKTILWTTNATEDTLSIAPEATAIYSCTVLSGNQTCTASIEIAVNPVSWGEVSATIVAGESYVLGTQTLTESGEYDEVFTGINGCDSTVTLYLNVVPELTCNITAPTTTLCAGESVTLSMNTTGGVGASNNLPLNLQNGLVAYYPFNGNANDESGNGNDGTVNGALFSNDRSNVPNSSILFNRQSPMQVGVAGGNLPNDFSFYSVSLWVNLNSYANPGDAGYNHFINRASQSGYQFVFANNTAGLYFYYGTQFFQTTVLPPLNQWVNLAVTYDYGVDNICKFYMDGQELAQFVTMQPLSSSNSPMTIGTLGTDLYNNVSTDLFNNVDGRLDELVLYNRILSNSEIQQLYTTQSYAWSNSATTSTTTVSPTSSTTYSCTVISGSQTCTASIDIAVTPQSSWYADADGDGFGNPNSTQLACTQPVGFVSNTNDCNDNQALAYTGAVDVCDNGMDEDCSGTDSTCIVLGCTDVAACNYNALANTDNASCTYPIQTYLNCNGVCINDTDSDGVCNEIEVAGCTDPTAFNFNSLATDDNGSCVPVIMGCMESSACNFNPAANTDDGSCILPQPEVCNGLDENCNGLVDDGLPFVNYYNDLDGDGFGAGVAIYACQSPNGNYALNNGDCNANNATIFPGAMEICGDGVDQDCLGGDLSCGGTSPDDANTVLNIGQFGTGVQSNNSVNFINANSTVQSPGAGLDKWYQFTAVTNAVRIGYKGSTSVADDNRLMLFNDGQPMNSTWVPLTTEDNVHPGALGASTDGGNETILYDDLVVGNQYFVCVQNTNATPGTGSMTVSWLYGSKGDIGPYTNYTYSYNNVCQNFKAQFRPNGKFYTVKRWASAAATGVPDWTYTIPVMNSTVCQLGKILSPNLTSTPQQKYITVDVLYKLPNAFGTVVDVNAIGTVITSIGLNGEGALLVRSSDACPIYKSTTGTIATNRSVCGTSYYSWRFDLVYPTTGLPISINGAMGASRIMPMANVSGIANGQRYDVQIKPVHIDNLNQTGYSGVSCVRTLGAAGMVAEETVTTTEGEQGHWTIYPNPNRGEGVALMLDGMDGEVELELMDATGRLLEKTTWNVEDSTQREWSFNTPLNSGLYEIRIQQGVMQETLRMVVVR